MIDTFDKHIDFCCFYQYKTVVRIFRITENRLFESDFDRFPELENLVGKKIRGKAVGAVVSPLSAEPLKNRLVHSFQNSRGKEFFEYEHL